jgi:hypothetical protein
MAGHRPGHHAARPPRTELAGELSALREVSRQLDRDLAAAPQASALRRERARLEAAVRARVLRTPVVASARGQPFTLGPLLDALDGSVLVELAEVDGVLQAVTVSRSGIRLHAVGSARDAAREVRFARFLLRRLADGRPVPSPAAALADTARLLEAALLGPAAAELGRHGVVIVPPGRLHAIPWGLLHGCGAGPSASALPRPRGCAPSPRPSLPIAPLPWSAARGWMPPSPSLRCWPGGTPGHGPRQRTATAGRVLAALDDCWLAHIAAHGTFRADNPLFSSVQLDDGPLTVYDLEGLRRAPHRLVLSSCESGRAAPTGATSCSAWRAA